MKLLAIVLTLIFLVLKLTGVIAWSWVAVFAPVLLLVLFFVLAIILVGYIASRN